jgi:biopolymer transport protein ExbD
MTVKINRGQAAGLINLTPMIDVVFQLLLFFLVASRFADEERQMKFPLPEASEARPLTAREHEYVINIDREGQYFVSGRSYSLGALQTALRQAAANNPRQAVIIRADKRVALDHVVGAGNACSRANLRYTITADPRPRSASQ